MTPHDFNQLVPPTMLVRIGWGAREATREACAEDVALLLNRLRESSAFFSDWKQLGRSKADSNRALDTSVPGLAKALKQQHKDIPRAPIPKMGFNLTAWTGAFKGGPSANIDVTLGAYDGQYNGMVLRVATAADAQFADWGLWRTLLLSLTAQFAPDWGTAGPLLQSGISRRPGAPHADWMVFLRDKFTHSLRLPPAVHSLKLAGLGQLIMTGPTPPSPSDDASLVALQDLADSLPVIPYEGSNMPAATR